MRRPTVLKRPSARRDTAFLFAAAALLLAAVLPAACGPSASTARPSATAGPTATAPATTLATPSPNPASPACIVTSTGPSYRLETCLLDSPSLAGNLLAEPAVLSFFVLTPVGYETSGIRYPSVYFLTGYTDNAYGTAQMLGTSPRSASSPAGSVPPIVVAVSGKNVFGGAMYANSTVSGNWEDAITRDLVGYVDAHYRTIAVPASRGLAGHSMGGAGSVNIALRHPELFAVLYAMSPAVFDAANAQNILGEGLASRVLDIAAEMASVPVAERAAKLEETVLGDGNATFAFAYGTAFAPDPASPLLMQFPYKRVNGQIVRDDAVWAIWDAGWGNLPQKVQQYGTNLKKYSAIGVDYGTADEIVWIPPGSHLFVTLLQGAGIEVTEATFAGGHVDQVGDRILNHMLPFMSEHLADR
jgi:S-formylglutathione hydrolase FrmB